MTERKEPTISAYSPAKDEMARPQEPNVRAKGKRPAPQAPRSSAQSPAARPIAAKSPLPIIAFLFALIACGGAGFLYWQLLETHKLLAAADIRIKDLESKFELSDDETAVSTEAMQAKLKWADSEIRKLWGVSYDTNRKAIATNKANLAKVKKTADSASKSVDSKIAKATKDIMADLKLVNELVEVQQTSLVAVEDSSAQIESQTQAITNKLNSLEASKKEFERRIKTNEQAVEAIDAFRRNVNQQLLQLKGGA